jgi:hypothetical protein
MFHKAIGTIVIMLSGLLTQVPNHEPPKPSPPPAVKKAEAPHHDPPEVPDGAEKAAPKRQPIPLEREPRPGQPPPKDIHSEPTELSPIAKAIISTNEGEEVPKFWPAGVPLTLTSIRSTAGDLPQSREWEVLPVWVNKYSNRGPGNRMISIATGTKAKTVKVTLYVAKADTFDKQTVVIAIKPDPLEPGNDDRPVPPSPDEPVPPEPAPPPALTTVGKQVYDLALKDIADIKARRAGVHALAASHERLANDISQAVAGVPAYANLKTPQGIIDATVKSNRAAVGDDRPAYVTFFTDLNNQVLKPLVPSTLATAGGHIEVWKDIAAGLRAASP